MKNYKKTKILSYFITLSLSLICPVVTYAASDQVTSTYNSLLAQFSQSNLKHLKKNSSPLDVNISNSNIFTNISPSPFSLDARGLSPVYGTLNSDQYMYSNNISLKSGTTIEVNVSNTKSNGNFEIAIVLNGHTMVSKKSTDKKTSSLTYITKSSGDFSVKITNLSKETIKVSGTVAIY